MAGKLAAEGSQASILSAARPPKTGHPALLRKKRHADAINSEIAKKSRYLQWISQNGRRIELRSIKPYEGLQMFTLKWVGYPDTINVTFAYKTLISVCGALNNKEV